VDVLADPAIREGIKEYSQWPTIPQLYIRGEFVGGCDIIQELSASGELATSLGVEMAPADFTPTITITPVGAEALGNAARTAPEGTVIRLGVDARFQNKLYFAPPEANDIKIESRGIAIMVDRLSANRANGIIIDMIDTPQGPGFRIENPNAPGGHVQQMSVQELKKRLDSGTAGEVFDVRTPEERAKASIPGTRLVSADEADRITGLPKDIELIFHSHHGGRSQASAEHFANLGFTNVFNVVGGIDAWSQEIDPDAPRY
jgi:monothiol glutaredoxin